MNATDAATVQVGIPAPEAGWTNRTFSIVTTGQANAFMRARGRNQEPVLKQPGIGLN